MSLLVALAGNPNSGKTTIFNNLTGARQKVANYPGVTVERIEGRRVHKQTELRLVDLPGTYSLSAFSLEERIARDFVLQEKPDVVINVVDSTNLERNLYLAVQLRELGARTVFAFNMFDELERSSRRPDLDLLSRAFGAPIVPTVGTKRRGMNELLDAVLDVAGQAAPPPLVVSYGHDVDAELLALERELGKIALDAPVRWVFVKAMEGDIGMAEMLGERMRERVAQAANRLEEHTGDEPAIAIAEGRYGFVTSVCRSAISGSLEIRRSVSQRVDALLLNRILGLPIFLGLMYLVFQLTFTLGEAPMGWIESLFNWLGSAVGEFWPEGSNSVLRSLLVDGVIGGVGGVIVFLPNIIFLFFAIALLEATGYMARAAFLLDKLMSKIGLNGKSFIPMLTGFGCSVPAIMATRSLNSERDRLATMFVVPLMSCSARLPIYALIIPAFFAQSHRALMMFAIYICGVVLAVLLALLLRSTVLRSKADPFVMELPPYRIPTLRSILIHTGERCWLYVKKAGTVILAISVVLWALAKFPRKSEHDRDYVAETTRAEARFTAAVDALGTRLGITNTSLATALAKPDAEPSNAKVASVLAAVFQLKALDLEFREAVTGLEKGSAEYIIQQEKHNRAVAVLRKRSPAVVFAAERYLNDLLPAHNQALAELEQAKQAEDLAYSAAGRIGKLLAPVMRPLGFDWRISTALIGAFAAKEVFVAQLGIVFSLGEADEESEDLRAQLSRTYTPLQAFCIMLFCLISAPCMATIAVTKRESNSWRWALAQLGGLTALAYFVTFAVYQVGTALQIGIS